MNPKRIAVFVCAIAALLLASCSDTETPSDGESGSHVVHWGYEADDGPANWGSLDDAWRTCAEGREQSPIDVASATEVELPATKIDRPNEAEFEALNEAGVISAIDNGHTIQVNAKTGETLTVGGKAYALLQFHFHAPSEHTVDGEHFPMEMHFVHQAEDGALAVVGVLVEEGGPNPGIAPIWTQLAGLTDAATKVQIPAEFAEQVFPGNVTGSYHYDGSLTTPALQRGREVVCQENANAAFRRPDCRVYCNL